MTVNENFGDTLINGGDNIKMNFETQYHNEDALISLR
jgi:hypothetical protein